VSLLALAARVLDSVHKGGRQGCLVGGLAVSARSDPRFTRDVDLAVAVDGDAEGEALIRALASDGFMASTVIEQDAVGRMAMVRLSDREGTSVDILFASSGIEKEIVRDAEPLEVVRGVIIPVARIGHLIALKLLSVAPGRETDAMDLRALARVANDAEWGRARAAVQLIEARGFARDRDLIGDLGALVADASNR
jgi:predicted nucleotidyltransferase